MHNYWCLLPTEICLKVFRFATTSDLACNHSTVAYIPFQTSPGNSPNSALNVKSTLVLVCQEWRYLATEFLYEDLRILRGTQILKELLDQEGYGRLVRRVVLPYPSTVTGPNSVLSPIDILRLCTNMETLVRPRMMVPGALQFHFEAEEFPFRSLKRLDWWYHAEAERSGGINSLAALLRNSPNLCYLSIGGVTGYSHIHMYEPLCLPELRTLRLHGGGGFMLHQIVKKWSLPALIHVIVDSPLLGGGFQMFWEAFGLQLQVVEFGKNFSFLMLDHITSCLRSCPNLTEINYYICFTMFPRIVDPHPSITTIRLHASVNEALQDCETVCSHVKGHFDGFTTDNFPALRTIVLHGEKWQDILLYASLTPTWRRLYDSGCALKMFV